MHRDRSHPAARRRVAALLVTAAASLAACAGEPTADVDPQTYRSTVNTICAATQEQQAEVVSRLNPDEVEPFAREVAALLTSEAEQLRAVTPPDAIAGDHRALIQNTDDQARRWTELAVTPPDDTSAFGALQTEILQLTLGRDDLAAEMALEACRRAPA